MKHNIFRYIAIAAALLATAVNAGAQYNIDNGVGTSKQVTGPDSNGNYTIRLETFATGTTTVTESATPVDVVLVLDVSGSMEEPKGTPTKLPRGTRISYNTIANSEISYFYKDRNGYWNKIYPGTDSYYGTTRYYLYYDYGQGATRITNYTYDPDAAILTTENNDSVETASMSKMDALKDAVNGFIDTIELNDHQDKNGNERARLHNRISIITFSDSYRRYCGLTRTEGNVETLKGYVESFSSSGGTNAGQGMSEANSVLQNASSDANKVVIMFTDGAPTDNYAAIAQAYTIKSTRGASVFSIGVFDSNPDPNGNVWKYMQYVSSNYPNARSISNPGTGGNSDAGFYQDASSKNADLTAIFKAIAEGIGGSTKPVGSSTQVRDVVTNSFVLPNNVSAADVHVYTSAATGNATGPDDTNPAGWATPVEITDNSVTPKIVNVDANGDLTEDATKVKNKALFVEGFEYSKADSSEGAGDGNWVGLRFKNNKWFWAGKKLIITFKVKADPEATGGESLTNTGKSGVYIKNDDGSYTCVNSYEQPHTTLSVNIKIRKTGLRHGESATFELMRIRPKGYNPNGATLKDKIANLEYNLIGKPKPGTTPTSVSPEQSSDMSDYYKELGWEGFKKVILTNKGDDGAEVVKDVLALDPYWVYMVLEDDWGWAYTMTGDNSQVGEDGTYTTSSVEVNPFRFHNTENPNAVKHAEAIMVNHFKSSESGSKEEHYKSSKVESFE